MDKITFQTDLRPLLPTVFGPKDYHEFRDRLEQMDRILLRTGLETAFIIRHLEEHFPGVSAKRRQQLLQNFRTSCRYCILLSLTGWSVRDLAVRVADSHLFQWFVSADKLDSIQPASKSAIDRYGKMFEEEQIRQFVHDLNRAMQDENIVNELLYQETVLRFDRIFADTTCVKANIHFPVDWVLLRDAVRTLILAIELIRGQGLKHRMPSPRQFITQINGLCMQMTQSRRKKGGTKLRKKTFRAMKKVAGTVKKHAERYVLLLKKEWERTQWTEIEAGIIIDRINGILDQLPAAVDQAHERIIGGRKMKNADKILSLYDPDVHVLIRGKAGAETEFGTGLYLAEQEDGLIADWDFMKEQPLADSKITLRSIERLTDNYGKPESFAADRGFHSKENSRDLENLAIFNAICPKPVVELQTRMEEKDFSVLQKRRASTEARIGIFKNAYLGNPMKSRDFDHKNKKIAWAVLVHNLWKVAGMAVDNCRKNEKTVDNQAMKVPTRIPA